MQTAEPVGCINTSGLVVAIGRRSHCDIGRRTIIGSATAAQDRIPAGILDRGDDGTRWRSAFDKDKLVLQVCINLFDSCVEVAKVRLAPYV